MKDLKKSTAVGLISHALGYILGLLLLGTGLYYTFNNAMPLLNRWWPNLDTSPVTWNQAMIWTLFIRFICALLTSRSPDFKD